MCLSKAERSTNYIWFYIISHFFLNIFANILFEIKNKMYFCADDKILRLHYSHLSHLISRLFYN